MGIKQQIVNTKRAWRKEATWYLTFVAVSFAFGDLLFGM